MNETTHLDWWTLNAKKWREANGFVTPEWMQYKDNIIFKNICSNIFVFFIGVAVGIAMCIS